MQFKHKKRKNKIDDNMLNKLNQIEKGKKKLYKNIYIGSLF